MEWQFYLKITHNEKLNNFLLQRFAKHFKVILEGPKVLPSFGVENSCMSLYAKELWGPNFDYDLTAVASVGTQLFAFAQNLRPFSDSIDGFLDW